MKVFLSKTAGEQVYRIIEYLESRWPPKVRDNFLDKLERSMEVISKMPLSFPASSSFPGLRKCVITPQTTAYYRVDESQKEVEIVAILDTRGDLTAL